MLIELPADCAYCAVSIVGPSRKFEVRAADAVDHVSTEVRLEGRLEILRADANGLVYRLHEASVVR
jgi:hypothetical protein